MGLTLLAEWERRVENDKHPHTTSEPFAPTTMEKQVISAISRVSIETHDQKKKQEKEYDEVTSPGSSITSVGSTNDDGNDVKLVIINEQKRNKKGILDVVEDEQVSPASSITSVICSPTVPRKDRPKEGVKKAKQQVITKKPTQTSKEEQSHPSPGSSIASVTSSRTPTPVIPSRRTQSYNIDDRTERGGRKRRPLPKSRVFVVRGGSLKGSGIVGIGTPVGGKDEEESVSGAFKSVARVDTGFPKVPRAPILEDFHVSTTADVGHNGFGGCAQNGFREDVHVPPPAPQFGCIPMMKNRKAMNDKLSPQKSLRGSMLRVSLQCDDYIRFMMRNNSQYCLKADRGRKRRKPKKMLRAIYKTFVRTFRS